MVWPNFFVVGAPKAGTTSLYHYLRQHPDVFMSPVKEPQYYARDDASPFSLSRDGYLALFAGAGAHSAIGEASPQYLHAAQAAGGIAADVPGARIVISLRDPVERAWSSYLQRLRGARERRDPAAALRRDSYYVATSHYAEGVARYQARFGRERVHVLLFEELRAETLRTMRGIFAFLQVDAAFQPDLSQRYNPARVPRSRLLNQLLHAGVHAARIVLPRRARGTGLAKLLQRPLLRPPPPMPAALRHAMRPWFHADVEATSALIGRDLSHWLAPEPRPDDASPVSE
jgi:hypothetical protein